jgi:hypothetical protein
VIAGAPQRKRQVQLRHAGQVDLEQGGVFEGELAVEEGREFGVAPANPQGGLKATQLRLAGET